MTSQEVPFNHDRPEEAPTEPVQGIREPDAGSDPAPASDEEARAVPARLGDAGMGERGSEHDGGDAHVRSVNAAIVAETTYRSGPLPDPGELAAYEQALPGAAERIMYMTERAVTGKEFLTDHTVAGVAFLSLPIVQFIRLLLPRRWFE
jgi:hypothetical protein